MSSQNPDAPDKASWTKSAVLLYTQGSKTNLGRGLTHPVQPAPAELTSAKLGTRVTPRRPVGPRCKPRDICLSGVRPDSGRLADHRTSSLP